MPCYLDADAMSCAQQTNKFVEQNDIKMSNNGKLLSREKVVYFSFSPYTNKSNRHRERKRRTSFRFSHAELTSPLGQIWWVYKVYQFKSKKSLPPSSPMRPKCMEFGIDLPYGLAMLTLLPPVSLVYALIQCH